MKRRTVNRIVSLVVAVATLISVMPVTAITVSADGNRENGQAETMVAEPTLTPAEAVEKEMASRNPIKKDRAEVTDAKYAVYVDGKLYKKGEFEEIWKLAMELAPHATEDPTHGNGDQHESVEFVLYTDTAYNSTWFSEKTMTISNKKITIDLNGHILKRTDKGSVIKVKNNAVLTVMDSAPEKKHVGTLDSDGKWSSGSGEVTITGGVITGGNGGTGDGAGIYIEGQSTVYLQGGTIAGNQAYRGSAVYLKGQSTLDMSLGTSQICYNYCTGISGNGGTIFLNSNCTVIGGYVHHNLVRDYGGGIRAMGNDILIKNVAVYANKAEGYGGGLYTERSGIGQTVTVTGCKIIGNFACKAGGGAYLYDLKMLNMSDCLVESNLADKEGGGICVSEWMDTKLTVSGKMIVRNNHVSGKSQPIKSNLYLESDNGLIAGALSLGSEIRVRTESAASSYNGVQKPIVAQETSTSHLFFFADEDDYCVKYQDDLTKPNYRYLYLEKGKRYESGLLVPDDYSVRQTSSPYQITTGAYKGVTMPLYRGYFEFELMTTSEFRSASPFYYSDGYFLEDPAVYNTHLASMSVNLAAAAFVRSASDVGDDAYANPFANVKQLLSDIGCEDVHFYVNEDYQKQPAYYFGEGDRLSTIGVAISQKEIVVDGDSYTLVPIAIRGDSCEAEWASNITIGNSGEAKGFADAADQVYKHIQYYVENYGLTDEVWNGKVKFWIVGYSGAGAAANLTAKRLVDDYAHAGNQVYGYTFEAPKGGWESAKIETDYTGYGAYPTIHNTVNELDYVPILPPSEMGFIRYGVDHLIGTDYANGITVESQDYIDRLKIMYRHLHAINPYYQFDERWNTAELSLIYGALFGYSDTTVETAAEMVAILMDASLTDERITSEGDDGIRCLPAFLANMGAITANHYPEITIAWVRSNDTHYTSSDDYRAYTIDTSGIEAKTPTGTYASATGTVTLSAQAGSSIFYSVDGGNTWNLYTRAVALESAPDQILCFSIYRGAKSEITDISLNGWAGSILGNGNIWFLLIGSAFIVACCVIGIETSRTKKKEPYETED